jgi:hypothetical protein
MAQTCTICQHAEREKIDAEIIAGARRRRIAARFGGSATSPRRHQCHIAQDVVRAAETFEQERGTSLLEKIYSLEAEAKRLGRKAEQEGDLRAALLAFREHGASLGPYNRKFFIRFDPGSA